MSRISAIFLVLALVVLSVIPISAQSPEPDTTTPTVASIEFTDAMSATEHQLEIDFQIPLKEGDLAQLQFDRLTTVQLIYRWQDHTGWYFVNGQPLASAFENFAEQHKIFLEGSIQSLIEAQVQERVMTEISPAEAEPRASLQKEFEAQLLDLSENGLRVSAIVLIGYPDDFAELLAKPLPAIESYQLRPLGDSSAEAAQTGEVSQPDTIASPQGGDPYPNEPWKFSPNKGQIRYDANSKFLSSWFHWSDVSGFTDPHTGYEHDIVIYKEKDSYIKPVKSTVIYSNLPSPYLDTQFLDKAETVLTIGSSDSLKIKAGKEYYVGYYIEVANSSAGPALGNIKPQLSSWAGKYDDGDDIPEWQEKAYCALGKNQPVNCMFRDQIHVIGSPLAKNGTMFYRSAEAHINFPFDHAKSDTYSWDRTYDPDNSIQCPKGQFKGEYFNNESGNRVLIRCDSKINFDWGNGSFAPAHRVDKFGIMWTGKVTLNAGAYNFIARADDGIRVWLDGTRIINGWKDQGPTEYKATRTVSAGDHDIKVEYYENGGGAVAQFRWEQTAVTCNSSQYRAEYFNNRTLSGSPAFVRCEEWPINFDWGNSGPGNGIGNDNFSVRWAGTANISAGSYTFIARADDGIRVWLDDTQIINGWMDQGPTEYRSTRSVSSGNHTIKVEYYENGGGAVAQFRWEQASTSSANLAKGRSAYAYTYESSSYLPSKGNDGYTNTRWSSGHRTSLPQWWWVDLGSVKTFDRVVIRWEAAYATRYYVGWSSNGTNYTGYNFTRSSAGTVTHNIGTRTARYVGIKMDARASGMNNFSFWEVEVYRTTRSALSPEEVDATEVIFTDEVVEGALAEPDGDLYTVERHSEPALQPDNYEIFLPFTNR